MDAVYKAITAAVKVQNDLKEFSVKSITETTDESTGIAKRVVIDWRGSSRTSDLKPAMLVLDQDGKPVKLTVTEFLLLQALAQRPGFVKSRDNLMDAAYDDQVYVDDRTIDSHVKRMRKKFRAVDPEFDAIETLYGVGYRYRES